MIYDGSFGRDFGFWLDGFPSTRRAGLVRFGSLFTRRGGKITERRASSTREGRDGVGVFYFLGGE